MTHKAVPSDAPTISIVIPTYNRRQLLAEAIASIQRQSYSSWELIIVDDGSTDGTGDSLPNDRRISYIAHPHTGNVATVHNSGLAAATGAYVAFLDSDDLWIDTHLERLVTELSEHPDCGWCYGAYRLVDAERREIPIIGAPWRPRRDFFVRELLTTEAGIPLQTIMVRRSIAQALRFDARVPFGDDYDFVVRLARSQAACVVDALVTEIREHSARGTRTRHDASLYIGLAYLRYRRTFFAADPDLRQICRQRAAFLLRHYFATERAAGRGAAALWRIVRLWVKDR